MSKKLSGRVMALKLRQDLLLVAMGDYVVLDAVIDLVGHYAALRQVQLGVVRPETDDAACPTTGHARKFHQLLQRGVVDVCAILGRRRWTRLGNKMRRSGFQCLGRGLRLLG